jgi:hypothetical protein
MPSNTKTIAMKTVMCLLMLIGSISYGATQAFIDTLYTIQTTENIIYGQAVDFAGTQRSLELDLSVPINDTMPICGRPLLIMIHGGAWIAGDKNQLYPKRIREDFAKRGYAAAAVNYRLGMFHTDQFINCNIADWNCFNVTDTSEWYRANYRAVQDVRGAIRYLINHATQYHIDPDNVFVVGESAGGFVAMGVGYLDDPTEVVTDLTNSLADAPVPNMLYENNCIQDYGLANTIAEMSLSRPNLGSYEGFLNLPALNDYTIRGVGNYYGGVFNNIFTSSDTQPALYLYHQPCDLIVPYNYSRLLTGYVNCLQGFPAFCGNIINRAYVYGSFGIKTMLDTLGASGLQVPTYYFDNTNNQWNCLQQVNQNCHSIDNFWLRTTNMAAFFAPKIVACTTVNSADDHPGKPLFVVHPNPSTHGQPIQIAAIFHPGDQINIVDINGNRHYTLILTEVRQKISIAQNFPAGIYFIQIKRAESLSIRKLLIIN